MRNVLPTTVGSPPKLLQPVFVAQQKHGGCAGFFVRGFEHSSDERLHAEDVEEIPRNDAGFDAFGFGAAEEDELHVVVLDDAVHAAALRAIVDELRDGRAADSSAARDGALAEHQQALAVCERQRLQQHRVDDAEDCGVGADAKTQNDDRGDGEAEIFAHHAHGEAGVLLEHRPMLARGRREDAFRGFPPEAQDAHFVAAAARLFALFREDLLHLRAVVAAKFGGE